MTFELRNVPVGQWSWRVDKSLLHDSKIIGELEREINLFFKENYIENINPSVLWETYKAYMRARLRAEKAKRKKYGKLRNKPFWERFRLWNSYIKDHLKTKL